MGLLQVAVDVLTLGLPVVVIVDGVLTFEVVAVVVGLELDVVFTVADVFVTVACSVAVEEEGNLSVVDGACRLLLLLSVCFGLVLPEECGAAGNLLSLTFVFETVFVMMTDGGLDDVSSMHSISGIIPIEGF